MAKKTAKKKTVKKTAKKTARKKAADRAVKNKAKRKKKPVRRYRPEFAKQAFERCSQFGARDVDLAKYFEVAVSTLNNWKREHEGFAKQVQAGKDEFDTDMVESKLLENALGTEYDETTYELELDAETGERELIATKIVTKKVQGSVAAQKHWLNNRKGDRWKDKQDVNIGGQEGRPIEIVTFENASK